MAFHYELRPELHFRFDASHCRVINRFISLTVRQLVVLQRVGILPCIFVNLSNIVIGVSARRRGIRPAG